MNLAAGIALVGAIAFVAGAFFGAWWVTRDIGDDDW